MDLEHELNKLGLKQRWVGGRGVNWIVFFRGKNAHVPFNRGGTPRAHVLCEGGG